jgi:hypothetical protein
MGAFFFFSDFYSAKEETFLFRKVREILDSFEKE